MLSNPAFQYIIYQAMTGLGLGLGLMVPLIVALAISRRL